ncbi:hypothetical protein FIBSPDRAFT_1047166 [Athelia psychrophila]|uniref:Uncharacterized protein n=1 Tax=Athelia psychrophila TaxID=1759441 RepID=A0A166FJI6_9AGAM|nr:hypothetical protein FIBSPDRAFT_1047166 [Fibularhizoctonia sp. CBS 109695]
MLLLLLVYHLFQEGANALPITCTDAADSGTPSACLDIRHCRQIADIVIGCLATVFACTWVSLHNNVPPPDWSTRKKWWDRIGLAVIALVLPEVIVVMAVTEFLQNVQISKGIENAYCAYRASLSATPTQMERHESLQSDLEATEIAILPASAASTTGIHVDERSLQAEVHSSLKDESKQPESGATGIAVSPADIAPPPAISADEPSLWTKLRRFVGHESEHPKPEATVIVGSPAAVAPPPAIPADKRQRVFLRSTDEYMRVFFRNADKRERVFVRIMDERTPIFLRDPDGRRWAFVRSPDESPLAYLRALWTCLHALLIKWHARFVYSFFVQMGGFYLDDQGESIGPLSGEDMAILVRHGYVLPPAEDIEDKSNGDWFSKSVALLQTFWFLAQCIARRAQHLFITQLEVVTLSYCAINLMIYAFWWHKPLNVDRPIHIIIDITPFAPKDQAELRRKRDQRVPIWQEIGRQLAITGPNTANERAVGTAGDAAVSGPQSPCTPGATFQQEPVLAQEQEPALERRGVIPHLKRPIYTKKTGGYMIFYPVGVVFGALHFVALSYPFPSHTQRVLWCVCCVALFFTPALAPGFKANMMKAKSPAEKHCILLTAVIFVLLYIFARVTTMVISCTTLGSLPPSATDTVQWTRFIPHF